jgi:hypothetical protein
MNNLIGLTQGHRKAVKNHNDAADVDFMFVCQRARWPIAQKVLRRIVYHRYA